MEKPKKVVKTRKDELALKANSKKPIEKLKTEDDKPKTREKTERPERPKQKIKTSNIVSLVIMVVLLLGTFFAMNHFYGKIFALVVTFLLFIVLMIGTYLDKPKKQSKVRKVFKVIFTIILALFIVGVVAGCGFLIYVVKNAPDFESQLLKEKEATLIYDNEGNEYAKIGTDIRENIEYNQISEQFIDALIATEDSRFFQHNGFDLMRFLKAAGGQIVTKLLGGGDNAGGGSTLTMQVVKNTFTSNEDKGIEGIIRKFTDIYISIFQLEKNYTKEQIIEFYVNNHELIGNIGGIQEGSRFLFAKDAKDLTLPEAALVAGLYQAPTYYNPYNYPERAEKRRNSVLNLMVRHGYITKEEKELAEKVPVESMLNRSNKEANVYQGFIDLVCEEVKNRWGVDPYSVPMLIYTTMDRKVQDGINDIMNGKTYKWKDDVIQGAITVLNTTNGQVKAIGAGRNRNGAKSYNYATFDKDTLRQIGSTAKPIFDYGPGIEYNNWSTGKMFDDSPYTYSNGKKISNWDGGYDGKITLRQALHSSRNIPALKAFQQVDNQKIIEFVTSVGITPEIDSTGYIHEAHSIGAFTGASTLIMAGAYQIFSNGGYYYEPYSVTKVIFRETGEKDEYISPKVRVCSEATAYMITDVLKGVIHDNPNKYGLRNTPFATKTGTTNYDSITRTKFKLPSYAVRDYWVDGYTTDTVISTWLGYDKTSNKNFLNFNSDSHYRNDFFLAAAKAGFNKNSPDWTKPKSVVSVTIEFGTDPIKLPSANTPDSQKRTELFKSGTEPTEISTKYLALDNVTGLFGQIRTDGSVFLSWNAASNPGYNSDMTFGYLVYHGDQLLDFTTSTTYVASDGKTGQYVVKTVYKTKDGKYQNTSSGAYFSVQSSISVKLTGSSYSTYNVGDSIPTSLYDGSMVQVTNNNTGEDETSKAKITATIKGNNGETTVSSAEANTFKITYKIEISGKTEYLSNTIVVKEAEA